jgi:hypothetical protein
MHGTVRHGIARLFGRAGNRQAELAESRLAETCGQLAGAGGAELEVARAELAQRWAGRIADLLEEDPAAAGSLRVLVGQVQALLPAGVFAAGHSAAAGRDVSISASGSGVAAAVMDSPVIAGPGGTAIGRYEAAPRRGAVTQRRWRAGRICWPGCTRC